MTTNSQNAFDEWFGFMEANQDEMTERDKELCREAWKAAWASRGEFDAKVCDEAAQTTWERLNGEYEDPWAARYCSEQIRQKGSE